MKTKKNNKIIVPYSNGIDNETKGYVDITDIVNEALAKAERQIKESKKNKS